MLDFLQEFVVFLLKAAVWYVMFRILTTFVYVKLVDSIQQDSDAIKKIRDHVHAVTVEHLDGVYFWYDAGNNTFIAQGRTLEEIRTVLCMRWQQHVFLMEDQQIVFMGPDFQPVKIVEKTT
jgi:hypothetical protein